MLSAACRTEMNHVIYEVGILPKNGATHPFLNYIFLMQSEILNYSGEFGQVQHCHAVLSTNYEMPTKLNI